MASPPGRRGSTARGCGLDAAPRGGAEQAIEEHGGQHGEDEGHRPRRRVLRLDEPAAERTEHQAPSVGARGERREAAERGEVDARRRLRVPATPPPERGHARQGQRRPAEGEEAIRLGTDGVRVDELAPGEGEQKADRRPPAEPAGIGACRARAPRPPARGASASAPSKSVRQGSRTGQSIAHEAATTVRGPPTRRSRPGSGRRCASGVGRRPAPPRATRPEQGEAEEAPGPPQPGASGPRGRTRPADGAGARATARHERRDQRRTAPPSRRPRR